MEQILQTATSLLGNFLWYAVVGAVVLAVLFMAWRFLGNRGGGTATTKTTDQKINVESLGPAGPPANPPKLEFFDTPVRLAAVVVAPVGNANELPGMAQMASLLESIVPGFSDVVVAHRAVVRRWPSQLSPRGFTKSFGDLAPLPGNGGKGTPWCSASGVFRHEKQVIALGLILRAAGNIQLGQKTIERETWREILRVRLKG
jgi:hypothetical protein